MKYLSILILFIIPLSIHAQNVYPPFDGHKWEAPYDLPIPNGWTIERFLIPISFAPQISYKGVEDIRFSPGWGDVKSDEYWTYTFLWFLDNKPKTNAKIIAKNLKNYYTGLIKVNSESYKVPAEKLLPVQTSFKKIRTLKGDLKTFSGTIKMLDYMQQKPITLYCIAHLKFCSEENKAILFYQLSPQPFMHKNWVSLNQLWNDFKCKK